MVSARLIRLIEQHSEELAKGLVKKLHSSPQTRSLQRIAEAELQVRIQETLCQFHAWLLTSADVDIEHRYSELGRHHATKNVALQDLCWAIVLIKEYLWQFVGRQVFYGSTVEIFAELEFLRLVDVFFDKVLCYMAEGYQQAQNEISGAQSVMWKTPNKYLEDQTRHTH